MMPYLVIKIFCFKKKKKFSVSTIHPSLLASLLAHHSSVPRYFPTQPNSVQQYTASSWRMLAGKEASPCRGSRYDMEYQLCSLLAPAHCILSSSQCSAPSVQGLQMPGRTHWQRMRSVDNMWMHISSMKQKTGVLGLFLEPSSVFDSWRSDEVWVQSINLGPGRAICENKLWLLLAL